MRDSRVHLVLFDDWELRGDGSGDMRAIQFDTLRALTDIYEKHGIRGTFNAEVLQQRYHLEHGGRHPELGHLAVEWEDLIRDVVQRGHDVQLHLHPQWHGATYVDGRWELSSDWSIVRHPEDRVRELLSWGRDYLQNLIRTVKPDYRVVSFRSGSWVVAPSDFLLQALIDTGIKVDVSVVEGLKYDTKRVFLDYSNVEEGFLPFYPDLRDARAVADGPRDIVCMPTHSFQVGMGAFFFRRAARAAGLRSYYAPATVPPASHLAAYGTDNWSNRSESRVRRIVRRLQERWTVSDLSAMSFPDMKDMVDDILRRARASGLPVVPVAIENHTKDCGLFEPFEKFARYIQGHDQVEVLTISEVVKNLEAGRYQVRSRVEA